MCVCVLHVRVSYSKSKCESVLLRSVACKKILRFCDFSKNIIDPMTIDYKRPCELWQARLEENKLKVSHKFSELVK